MKFFLTLKHWQMFGLLVVIPLCIQALIIICFQKLFISNIKNIDPIFIIKLGYSLLYIYGILLFFSWFYSLGTNLYSINLIPSSLKIKSFKILMHFIPIYFILFILLFLTITLFDFRVNNFLLDKMIFIAPIHFIAGISLIYCSHFVFKALNMVEKNRDVSGKEIFFDFLLLVIFPIGIWFIQPRINKIFVGNDNEKITNSN